MGKQTCTCCILIPTMMTCTNSSHARPGNLSDPTTGYSTRRASSKSWTATELSKSPDATNARQILVTKPWKRIPRKASPTLTQATFRVIKPGRRRQMPHPRLQSRTELWAAPKVEVPPHAPHIMLQLRMRINLVGIGAWSDPSTPIAEGDSLQLPDFVGTELELDDPKAQASRLAVPQSFRKPLSKVSCLADRQTDSFSTDLQPYEMQYDPPGPDAPSFGFEFAEDDVWTPFFKQSLLEPLDKKDEQGGGSSSSMCRQK
ncbi:hypothetical protein EJ06DRAFT_235113 [Trichodelitschia bisporula]|uniref:Uncharacterized protein n=1 Tax=Trichodelitschia bisporula TaxID=703511 RepID=A0A6G1HJU3_9PEZI|nr:hypothetical protein EJ06DRAFT_235113 [Trichodelitschia bisporula]